MEFIDRLFGKPSLGLFASQFICNLREAGETAVLRYDAAEQRIDQFRDRELVGVIHLNSLYGNYLAKPRAERPGYLRLCVRGAITSHKALPRRIRRRSRGSQTETPGSRGHGASE